MSQVVFNLPGLQYADSPTTESEAEQTSRTVEVVPSSDELNDQQTSKHHHDNEKIGYQRWIILGVAAIGGVLAAIQSSALIIAFPVLITSLESSITTMLWVLLGFLLVCSAIVLIAGKLGDMLGQSMLFNIGFFIFGLSCLLSGFAQVQNHAWDLIGYRILLGFGGIFLFSNSTAIITDVFLPYGQVGVAQGIFQLAFAAGTVLGPVVGGALAEADWRWIFWFNVPPAFICTILGFMFIREHKVREKKPLKEHLKTFDFIGGFSVIVFLTLVMLALTQAVLPDPKLSSAGGLATQIVIAAFALVLFLVNEHFWAKDPVMNLTLWTNKVFTLSTLAGMLTALARGNVTYAMIFFLQGPFGETPLTAGIQLIPLGLGIIITGFIGGFLADRIGVRNLCVIGPIVSALGMVGLLMVDKNSNYWWIAFSLFVIGCGNGLFNAPNGVAGLTSVLPTQRGVAAAIRLLFTFLPQMVGIVITFAFILNSLSYQQILILFIYGGGNLSTQAIDSFMNALHAIFYITMGAFIGAAIISAFIPGSFRPPMRPNELVAKPADASSGAELEKIETADLEKVEIAELKESV